MTIIDRILRAICGTRQQHVDVAAHLDELAAHDTQSLDWRHSIVDLMRLLGLNSNQQHRQDLAQELGYTGDMRDSAEMNTWLHREVMRRLAENGGQVPEELR